MRLSSIELLRIILMVMIVCWHILVHGVGLSHYDFYNGTENNTYLLYAPFLCFAVNCFFFISGYFKITFDVKKFIKFVIQILVYTQIPILGLLFGYEISEKTLIAFLFTSDLWFVDAYLLIMILSIVINTGFENISKKDRIIVLMLFYIFVVSAFKYLCHGIINDFYNAIFVYMLGRYMALDGAETIIKRRYILFFTSSSLLFLTSLILYITDKYDYESFLYVYSYGNPINYIAAISLFFIFLKLKIKRNKYINLIAKGVFPVYLLTDGILRGAINNKIVQLFGFNMFVYILVSIIIVISISLMDCITRRVVDKLTIQNFTHK